MFLFLEEEGVFLGILHVLSPKHPKHPLLQELRRRKKKKKKKKKCKSIFSVMTYDEKKATLPGLTPGKELPQSFLLPHCSMDFLWTFGLHQVAMGTVVHSNYSSSLISIALKVKNVSFCNSCSFPSLLPITDLKNIICSQSCCAIVKLCQRDTTPNSLRTLSISVKHCPFFYLIHEDFSTFAQEILSFEICNQSYLFLKLFPLSQLNELPQFKCLGVDFDAALIEHALSNFENGIILKSYQSSYGVPIMLYVGCVEGGIICYDQCNSEVMRENDLCLKCLKN